MRGAWLLEGRLFLLCLFNEWVVVLLFLGFAGCRMSVSETVKKSMYIKRVGLFDRENIESNVLFVESGSRSGTEASAKRVDGAETLLLHSRAV